MLKKKKLFKGAVVVAPRRVAKQVWPVEAEEWADFSELKVTVLHGPHKAELAAQRADVYVVTYEGLRWMANSGLLRSMFKKGWIDTLVIDELSKYKHPETARYKSLEKWVDKFERRWGLTGSPAANGLLYLFGQCYMLDLGNALGVFYTHYRFNFFANVSEYKWVPLEGAEEFIYDKLKNLALRMNADDYLELPKLIDQKVIIELPPEARKTYMEMEDELFALVDNKVVTAANAGVASMKCRQICSGAVYTSDVDPLTGLPLRKPKKSEREFVDVHDEKLDATEELMEELNGQQMLIAYNFNPELWKLQQRFPSLEHIGGGVSDKRSKELEDAWNAGELQYLAVHPAAAAHGLNLQKSSAMHVLWFSLTNDYELYDQLIRRLRRQGSRANYVFNHVLLARDTVDEALWYMMRSKEHTQQALFDALTTLRQGRRGMEARRAIKASNR